jgi:peptidoglycan/xylan/chitin deacetylase (PgdA/CDA1 family)
VSFRFSQFCVALLLPLVTCVVGDSSASATPVALDVAPTSWSSCPSPLFGPRFSAPTVADGARTVALTFDDGPGPSTARILSILLSFHVRATFFNIGVNEAKWASDVRAEATDGFEVADHTWSHPFMTTLSVTAQRSQLAAVANEQRSLVGSSPCAFRPPYGDYNATTSSLASSLSMGEWLWDVDTDDWQAAGSGSSSWTDRIISLAESEGGVQSHPIVLMHDLAVTMPATVAALPTIIRYFLAHHYQFVDLLGRAGPPNSCGTSLTPFATSPRRFLVPGGVLASSESFYSANGEFVLTQERNGVLALLGNGRLLWSTPTRGHVGAVTHLSVSGALSVMMPAGAILWHSSRAHRGDRLGLGNDGEISLSSGAITWWRTSTHLFSLSSYHALGPDWTLYSPNAECRLVMNGTGQLVLQSTSHGTLWSSRGQYDAGSSAILEGNGNLEVVSRIHHVVWASGSLSASATLRVTDAGRAVVSSPGRPWLWSNP